MTRKGECHNAALSDPTKSTETCTNRLRQLAFSGVVVIYTSDTHFLTELASVDLALGDIENAMLRFSEILVLDPENPSGKRHLGSKD